MYNWALGAVSSTGAIQLHSDYGIGSLRLPFPTTSASLRAGGSSTGASEEGGDVVKTDAVVAAAYEEHPGREAGKEVLRRIALACLPTACLGSLQSCISCLWLQMYVRVPLLAGLKRSGRAHCGSLQAGGMWHSSLCPARLLFVWLQGRVEYAAALALLALVFYLGSAARRAASKRYMRRPPAQPQLRQRGRAGGGRTW